MPLLNFNSEKDIALGRDTWVLINRRPEVSDFAGLDNRFNLSGVGGGRLKDAVWPMAACFADIRAQTPGRFLRFRGNARKRAAISTCGKGGNLRSDGNFLVSGRELRDDRGQDHCSTTTRILRQLSLKVADPPADSRTT